MIWLFIVTINSSPNEASSHEIIGGADGPTSIFITGKTSPYILRGVALIAALAFYTPIKTIFKRVFRSN